MCSEQDSGDNFQADGSAPSRTKTDDCSSHCPPPEKVRVIETCNPTEDDAKSLNSLSLVSGATTSTSTSPSTSSSSVESQDADYSSSFKVAPPQLMDELEALILARVPRSEYGKFCLVNKRFLSLVKSGEIYRIRRDIGFKEPTVFMLATGAQRWWAFDRRFDRLRELPLLPADDSFRNGDKETLCAGTHLLVSGKEEGVSVVWRYDHVKNQWLRGPSMIHSRSLFAGVTCGNFGYVAGGVSHTVIGAKLEDLSSAERYNPETGKWEILRSMHRKRKNCSGCYMDNKFYVIGGRNDEDGLLTCAEAYNEETKTWELIPDMLEGAPSLAPPLLAAVKNELYALEASTNQLKVYVKSSKSWRSLGRAPVIAGSAGGWGVAFKSLGDELLVIGGSANAYVGRGMIYTCRPDPNAEVLNWRSLEYGDNQLNPFILNCSVMFV